jgi:hypothetical protein
MMSVVCGQDHADRAYLHIAQPRSEVGQLRDRSAQHVRCRLHGCNNITLLSATHGTLIGWGLRELGLVSLQTAL